MKFTYNWLKQYVDFDWSPTEVAEKLTFAGIEVESMVSLGGKIPEQVVIAQILASENIPTPTSSPSAASMTVPASARLFAGRRITKSATKYRWRYRAQRCRLGLSSKFPSCVASSRKA